MNSKTPELEVKLSNRSKMLRLSGIERRKGRG